MRQYNQSFCTLKAKRQRHKLSYWAKLCVANNDRLLSIVFRNRHREVCAGGGHLSSLNAFRSTLIAMDFESCWSNCSTLENWPRVLRERSQALEVATQSEFFSSSSSLALYSGLQHHFSLGIHPYLDDRNNHRGTRLMSRLRFGSLWLMQY